MTNKTKLTVVLIFILGIIIGAVIFYFFLSPSAKPIKINLSPTISPTSESLQTTSVAISSSTSLSTLPIGVSVGTSNQWFESWAGSNDILIAFSNNLATSSKPSKGKLGWNNPSFANIKQTENQWRGKVSIILYDYETWEKTPADEQTNPEQTAKNVQEYADQKGVDIIIGASWKMVTLKGASKKAQVDPTNINFATLVDKEKIQAIAKYAKNFGVNAVGLRNASPDAYVEFFNLVAAYAKEVNPNIKLWPVLDARSQSADKMLEMVNKLQGNVDGVMIMGNDKSVISGFITLLRK